MIWSQLSTCWWTVPRRAYLYTNSAWTDGRVHTPFHLYLISMDTFAVLKVLFIFLSGPLCSAPFSISFLCSAVSYRFIWTLFLFHFPTPLSCPSFCFLSVSSHFLSVCLLSLTLVRCPPLSLPSLSLWFSITLYQPCLLHNPEHCFFYCLMFPASPGAEHFLLMRLL